MSVFNLDNQNKNLDNKIVAGLERLSQVFRILLWEKAKEHSLSPLQIQLLIFIRHHSADKTTVSYLAQEFNFTKPTISDAIKTLEQKQLIQKVTNTSDARSYTINLTAAGKKIVLETENFANPLTTIISKAKDSDKIVLWDNISSLIISLNKLEVISVQRTCFNCKHYSIKNKHHFCNLLDLKLLTQDIRIDCKEFEIA
ncbi:MarR family winged helix-turn-helix transcriptional regulator [Agriterribacter sp.]|uniref:MarR family winged helix-turn-helix transcriptional regulator n=1 Tax=Agriterribacter sp. TaxID=2821509 RepID=UPI002C4D4C3D|nr:MarR family winged helix-turn-helix transcriptional regulator [Agriterribacter sp.]HTN09138.1 MarR family winged helix-turn-helix transcriptional regulator [Agriterribacter sp.]